MKRISRQRFKNSWHLFSGQFIIFWRSPAGLSMIVLLSYFLSLSPQVNFSSSLDTGPGSASGSTSGGQTHLPLVALSPIIHPRIREFRSGLGSTRKGVCSGFSCMFVNAGNTPAIMDFDPPQMCLPLRSRSTTGTAPRRLAAPNAVSLAMTLRHQERPPAWAPCRRRPKGWRSAPTAPWGSGPRAPRPPSWASPCKVGRKRTRGGA